MNNEENKKNLDLQERNNRNVELSKDRPTITPATDIYESDKHIKVICDMPGVEEKDVDVSFEDDVLTLIGEQKQEKENKEHELVHRGFYRGVFKRSFNVLTDIEVDNISAKLKNGVLEITLPKAKKAEPKKIEVKSEE